MYWFNLVYKPYTNLPFGVCAMYFYPQVTQYSGGEMAKCEAESENDGNFPCAETPRLIACDNEESYLPRHPHRSSFRLMPKISSVLRS